MNLHNVKHVDFSVKRNVFVSFISFPSKQETKSDFFDLAKHF